MGFTSFKCAVSGYSIPAFPYAELPLECSRVVLVLPDGASVSGVYDGYGRIVPEGHPFNPWGEGYREGVNVWKATREALGAGAGEEIRPTLVRRDYYRDGDTCGVSDRCEAQGFFYNDEERERLRASVEAVVS